LNGVGRSLKRSSVDAEPPDVLSDLGVDGGHDGSRQYEGQGRCHEDVDDSGSVRATVRGGHEGLTAAAGVAVAWTVEVEGGRGQSERGRPDAEDETLSAAAGHDEPQRVDNGVEPVHADGNEYE